MTVRQQIKRCKWLVYVDRELLGCFVRKADACEFGSAWEYEHGAAVTITKAK